MKPGLRLGGRDTIWTMPPAVVLFDLNGTLIDQGPLEERLSELGAPAGTFDAWFERLLHSAVCLSVVGDPPAFSELAETTLATTFARLGVSAQPEEVLGLMGELPLQPDAEEALDVLDEAEVPAAVLTNSGADSARGVLRRNGVLERFAAVLAAADAGAYKPLPAPYLAAAEALGVEPRSAALVAAHAWDVVGAGAAGLESVWVDRLERTWPFPGAARSRAGGLAEAARMLVSARS